MPDTQIHPLGTVTAPGDFTIPGSAELQLKGVYASFDGSAAASSFIPLVRFISDAGSVALEAVADTTIVAGGSADASWFPRVAAAAAAAPISGQGMTWAYLPGTSFATVPAISGGSPGTLLIDGDQTSFYTNTGAAWTTATHVSGGVTYHGLAANEKGHYLLKAQVILSGISATGLIELNFLNFGSGTPASYASEGIFWGRVTGDSSQNGLYMEALFTVAGGDALPSGPWLVQVSNSTTATFRAYVDVIGIQTDTDPTVLF